MTRPGVLVEGDESGGDGDGDEYEGLSRVQASVNLVKCAIGAGSFRYDHCVVYTARKRGAVPHTACRCAYQPAVCSATHWNGRAFVSGCAAACA